MNEKIEERSFRKLFKELQAAKDERDRLRSLYHVTDGTIDNLKTSYMQALESVAAGHLAVSNSIAAAVKDTEAKIVSWLLAEVACIAKMPDRPAYVTEHLRGCIERLGDGRWRTELDEQEEAAWLEKAKETNDHP